MQCKCNDRSNLALRMGVKLASDCISFAVLRSPRCKVIELQAHIHIKKYEAFNISQGALYMTKDVRKLLNRR